MYEFNWIGCIIPALLLLSPIGMAIVLIRDKVKAKRRRRRCHRLISTWHELYVGDR